MKPEQRAVPADWLRPDWPAPAIVQALFTARSGGASVGPWHSMNLGGHVGDEPGHVAHNREILQNAIGCRPVFLNQIHGTGVEVLSRSTVDGLSADACVTTEAGLACIVMVADCLPVLFTTRCGSVVAAAHAGWRGLAGTSSGTGGLGVLESTVAAIYASFKAMAPIIRAQTAPEIIAWLGPCIGPAAFEVGAEVREAFAASQKEVDMFFTPTGQDKFKADLAALARVRLRRLGVFAIYGNDSSTHWCTASNPSSFFSHRRDASKGASSNGLATTGRMAASIWLGESQ